MRRWINTADFLAYGVLGMLAAHWYAKHRRTTNDPLRWN